MYVCLCKSVTDQQIKESVENGVTSFSAMRSHLDVSTACGKCECEVKQIIQKKLQKELSLRSATVLNVEKGIFA